MHFADIKRGVYLVLKKLYPCKIIKVNVSKTGKHGHAKKVVTGIDLITGKKHIDLFVHSTVLVVPDVSRIAYQLSNIDGEYISLMNLEDFTIREDLVLPTDEVGEKISELFSSGKTVEVVVLVVTFGSPAISQEKIIECKEVKL